MTFKEKLLTYKAKYEAKAEVFQTDLFHGLKYFFEAHTFVVRHNLYHYLLISGILFGAIFIFGIDELIAWIDSYETQVTNYVIKMNYFPSMTVEYKKELISGIFRFIQYFLTSHEGVIFNSIFLTLGSPYLSALSIKVENLYTHSKHKTTSKEIWFQTVQGIKISVMMFMKQYAWLLLIALFSFVPVIGKIAPLLVFIAQTYYIGKIMVSYCLDNHNYTVKTSAAFFKQYKNMSFAFGMGYLLLSEIPLIGWFISSVFALIATTLWFLKNKN